MRAAEGKGRDQHRETERSQQRHLSDAKPVTVCDLTPPSGRPPFERCENEKPDDHETVCQGIDAHHGLSLSLSMARSDLSSSDEKSPSLISRMTSVDGVPRNKLSTRC